MRLLQIIVLALISINVQAQIGFVQLQSLGPDAEEMKLRNGYLIPLAYPLHILPDLTDSTSVKFLVRPGFNFERLTFEESYIFNDSQGAIVYEKDPNESQVYRKNFRRLGSSIAMNTVMLPVEVRFYPRSLENLSFAIGVLPEYLMGGKFRRRYLNDGNLVTVKNQFKNSDNFYYINRFQCGAYTSIQWKYIYLFTEYSFIPVFAKNKGPEFNYFMAGIYVDFLTPLLLKRS